MTTNPTTPDGPKTIAHAKTITGVLSAARQQVPSLESQRKDEGNTIDELLARMSDPPTLITRPSQIILPILGEQNSERISASRNLIDPEPRMVRTLEELGTGIFCRGDFCNNDLLGLGKVVIGDDPKKIDLALSILKDLLNSVTLKKPRI